jgi:steroid delta-isomerase-like uncharacterized protein
MRKVSFALAIGFVLAACGGGEENQPPKTPAAPPVATTPATTAPTAEAPKEEPKAKESLADLQQKAVKGYVEATNAHDAKKLAGFYTDSAVVKIAGAPADATGRDAIAGSYTKLFEAFKDYTVAPSRVFVKGDVAIVEWAFNGTHTGDLWGIKATEKKAGAQGVDVLWFTPEGQIKEQHVYYDGATILSQVGLSKQKARPIPTLASKAEWVSSNGSPDEAKNVDFIKNMTGAIETKKEADFLATMTDTAEWDDMTQPQVAKGKTEAKKFFKEMTTGFPDAKMGVANGWTVNDFAIAETTMTGTHKGAFFGIPATKKTVSTKGLDIVQIKDGKMVKGASYSSGSEFAQQLGLMPKPGEAKAGAPGADAKKPADTKAAAPADAKKPAAAPKK